jgi:putative oxidoreductase
MSARPGASAEPSAGQGIGLRQAAAHTSGGSGVRPMPNLSPHAPTALAALRVVAGLLYLAHGAQKLFGFPPMEHAFPPEQATLMLVAGWLELVGGALVMVGLFTRPAAFVLSGMMAVAYWVAHAPQSPYPAVNHGDAAILFCFIFLYLVFAGPGRFALDGVIRRTPS